jgi:hypothetical protein
VIVSRPKSPPGFVAVTVIVFVPTANGTDVLNPVLQGNRKPAIKHSSPVSAALPLPPAELLQVTEVAVAERDPETVTVAAQVWPLLVGDSIVINPGISLGRSSSPPPPQALSPTSNSASTAESNCFRQRLALSMLLSLVTFILRSKANSEHPVNQGATIKRARE